MKRVDAPLLRTGFTELDTQLGGGFCRGELIVLASPGAPEDRGTLALQFALEVVLEATVPAVYFASQSAEGELLRHLIEAKQQVMESPKEGFFVSLLPYPGDKDNLLTAGRRRLSDAQIRVIESPSLTMESIRSDIESVTEEFHKNPGLIIIDGLQDTRGASAIRFADRGEEVYEIIDCLKKIAIQFRSAVILLSKLWRANEGRFAPSLRDLESAAICIDRIDRALLLNQKSGRTRAELLVAVSPGWSLRAIPIQFHVPTGTFHEREPNVEA